MWNFRSRKAFSEAFGNVALGETVHSVAYLNFALNTVNSHASLPVRVNFAFPEWNNEYQGSRQGTGMNNNADFTSQASEYFQASKSTGLLTGLHPVIVVLVKKKWNDVFFSFLKGRQVHRSLEAITYVYVNWRFISR